ncbi:MAG: Gfo/Idh/MocA family protein [Candidatus Kapaibacterium sp.]
MEKIKVSVIGTGHLGSIHAKLWHKNENAILQGIYDIDRDKAAKLSAEYNCRAFGSVDEAIDESDILTIAAPTSEHYAIAKKCIEQKKHCLIEKPITAKYEEAVLLIALARENGVSIQVGHVERFNPAISALKNYKIEPLFIETHRLSQFSPRATDVSVIHDLMIHDIDIMLWLVKSEVVSVDAKCVSVLTDTPDIANARIKFANGAVANITASRISARPMRKTRIFQKDAYISIDFASKEVEVYRLDDGESARIIPATMLGSIESGTKNRNIYFEKPPVEEVNAIAEEQQQFIDALTQGQPIPVRAEEAAEALRIAEEIAAQR